MLIVNTAEDIKMLAIAAEILLEMPNRNDNSKMDFTTKKLLSDTANMILTKIQAVMK